MVGPTEDEAERTPGDGGDAAAGAERSAGGGGDPGGAERSAGGGGVSGEAGVGELRASDADRERTAAILANEGAVGRLEPDECAARLTAAFAARTLRELYALTADLPYPDAVVPGMDPWPGRERRESLLLRFLQAWGRK